MPNSDDLYTLRITFHSAQNLPVADIKDLSCDPYLEAEIIAPSSPRNHELPPFTWRTPTVHMSRDPVWNCSWVVGGIPSSGFLLVMRVRDEDVRNKDDRLGKAVADFSRPGLIREGFKMSEEQFKIMKRKGSFRPWIQTYLAALIPGQKLRKHNRVTISVEVLSKCPDQNDRRIYTIGPNRFSQHFSPLIGHFVNRHITNFDSPSFVHEEDGLQREVAASTFIANKLQLTGPLPKEMKFKYYEKRPLVNGLFNDSGLIGHILYHGLRKQYRTLYSHDKTTLYGVVGDVNESEGLDERDSGVFTASNNSNGADTHQPPNHFTPNASSSQKPSSQSSPRTPVAQQFLKMTSYGTGFKLFTYVITIDGEWRFTETGDEYTIDFLSKHFMHAEATKIVAWAGEFFVRKMEDGEEKKDDREQNEREGRIARDSEDNDNDHDPHKDSTDPTAYELIIDNDSGTYRPPKTLLPVLHSFLSSPHCLGGLGRIRVLDGFDDELVRMKKERKEGKKGLMREGGCAGKRTVVKMKGKRKGVGRRASGASSVSAERMGLPEGSKDVKGSEVDAALEKAKDAGRPGRNGNENNEKRGTISAAASQH